MKQQVEIVWHIDDLKAVLQDSDLGVKDDFFTDEELYEVLLQIKRNHDACIGISWDTLEYALRYAMEKKQNN